MNQPLLTDISFFLLVFYTSLFLSLVLVPLSGRVAKLLGVLDHPDPRKIHRNPLPRMGGVGIAAAFVLGVLLCVKTPPLIQGVLLGAGIIVFTGLLDDFFKISPKLKFVGEILAVTAFMMVSGISLPGFGDLFGIGEIRFGFLAPVFTVFCMVGVINALNLSDGLDGLAAGLSAIVLFFIAVLAYSNQAWFFLVLALSGLGAILGFLRYNTHPAKLFMGDSGSLLLGFLLAALSVGLAHGGGLYKPVKPIVMATILALPVVDTLHVMTGRLRRGENPFLPDKTHLHHRLLSMGLPHRDVVTIIYGLSAVFGALGVLGSSGPEWALLLETLVLCGGIYGFVSWAEKNGLKRSGSGLRQPRRRLSGAKKPYQVTLARLAGKSTPYLLPLFLLFFLLPVLLIFPMPPITGYFSFASCLVVVLLYPWKGGRHEMPMAHGVFSVMIFCILLLYMFAPNRPSWLFWYFVGLSALALFWSIPKMLFTREGVYAIPSSFELILILLSWFVPVVLAPFLGISDSARLTLMQSCAMAVPILMLFKVATRRHARRNWLVASSFVFVFAFIGGTAFFMN
ncbi:glycosyltransferase family 4 protein [Desulfolithobacter dissulfuricans]|uniref:glycosyltransferase family 4 protein n=1 Tax=Desulfolithobacter dissulfuricans TaxID=2795293 RepID=UPI002278D9E5|nr:hypothetical protein [Desulfolithobacter dissulfuricans]